MTVCIAAACTLEQNGRKVKCIVGAADRMLTSEQDAIQYESPEPKIYGMSPHCFVMMAGDSSIQSILIRQAQKTIRERYKLDDPNLVIPILGIARIYADHFAEYRRELAERRLLTPRGLTLGTFREQQRRLLPSVVHDLDARLERAEIDLEVIVTGLDLEAPFAHIYVISDPGRISSADREGFAAIGIGAGHAESQFMFSRYSSDTPMGAALLLAYSAKKHSQTAPGVGNATDMAYVHPGRWGLVAPDELATLHEIYVRSRQRIDGANADAAREGQEYVEALLKAALARTSRAPSARPLAESDGAPA